MNDENEGKVYCEDCICYNPHINIDGAACSKTFKHEKSEGVVTRRTGNMTFRTCKWERSDAGECGKDASNFERRYEDG
jgi:hypothetical protein